MRFQLCVCGQAPSDAAAVGKQHAVINKVYKRWMSTPLGDTKDSWQLVEAWAQEKAIKLDASIKTNSEKSDSVMKDKYLGLELELTAVEPPRTAVYHKYITAEIEGKTSRPDRVTLIFERAIVDNALDSGIWLWYTSYAAKHVKFPEVVLSVHERAVRNCPWVMALWQSYALTSERLNQPHAKVMDVYERSLQGGFQLPSEFLELWALRCEYMFRRIAANEGTADACRAEWRDTVQRAGTVNVWILFFLFTATARSTKT